MCNAGKGVEAKVGWKESGRCGRMIRVQCSQSAVMQKRGLRVSIACIDRKVGSTTIGEGGIIEGWINGASVRSVMTVSKVNPRIKMG